jgi:multidrug efflux system outer membrane protein
VARLKASEKRSTSAFRALLPRLRFSGEAGYQAQYIDDFETQGVWGVGAVLSIPLYEGGNNHAARKQADAAASVARFTLQQAAFNAVQQVESALAREIEQKNHLAAVQQRREASRLAFQEARERYLAGLDSYVNVLLAVNIYQQAQLGFIQSHRDLIVNRIRIYHALGGAYTSGLGSANRTGREP